VVERTTPKSNSASTAGIPILKKPVIGFAGLSHLGICSSVAAATKGFQVVGYDDNVDLITKLCDGEPPIVEPELNEKLLGNKERLVFSDDAVALTKCDVVYLSRDVPTDDNGVSDLDAAHDLLGVIAPHLQPGVVVVILCQVPPGFTRMIQMPSAQVFYQVETLIFGRAMERAEEPERIIIGCQNPEQHLPEPYHSFLDAFNCPLLQMRYESAELSKIAINCFLVSSVSTTNTLAEICEKIGADWSEIVPALQSDRRIGHFAYLKPGLGIAGGNLERDLATVKKISGEHQTDTSTVSAWLSNSKHRKSWAFDRLNECLLTETPDAIVAIWGLAYKENTKSTKNSASLILLEELGGRHVRVFDPVVSVDLPEPSSVQLDRALEAVAGVHALVIMTPWPEFATYELSSIKNAMIGNLVIDPYGMLDAQACRNAGLNQLRLGSPLTS
jgi:UDPglucose 6-dehydrogenase